MNNNNESESQVKFEIKNINGEKILKQIQLEISALFDWLEERTLKELISEEKISELINKTVIEFPITDDLKNFIIESAKEILLLLHQNKTQINVLLSKNLFDEFVKSIIIFESLREKLIHQLLSSNIYSMFITDALYNGIKNFILTENYLLKAIPGVSSIMKIGQGFLNKTVPKLEETIDNKLKEFINGYIHRSISQSEKFLKSAINEKSVKQISENIWKSLHDKKVSEISEHITNEHLETLIPLIIDFWINFRKTPFFTELINKTIRNIFKYFSEDKIGPRLREIGISKDQTLTHLNIILTPLMENIIVSEFIGTRIKGIFDALTSQN